ncbi:MAG: hypothetical protein U1E76_21785 [Planctomycetota bacterium]
MPRPDVHRFARASLLLCAVQGGCFPRFDLPPGEALPDGALLAPLGAVLPLAGSVTSCDLCVDAGRVAIVASDGESHLQIFDLAEGRLLAASVLAHDASAARFCERGAEIVVLRASGDALDLHTVASDGIAAAGTILLADGGGRAGLDLAVDLGHQRACVLRAEGRLDLVDLAARQQLASAELRAAITACAITRGGARVACALAREDAVLLLDGAQLRVLARVALGDSPAALRFDDTGQLLYVGGARLHTVDVITAEVLGQGRCSLPAAASTAGILALGHDPARARVYVANRDENSVGVVDVQSPQQLHCLGLVPTDRAPRAALTDGRQLVIVNQRSLEITPVPLAADLARATATVRRNQAPRR